MTSPDAGDDRLVRLTLHYDGTDFSGWQSQPGTRTVQTELETALARLTGGAIRVAAAGRTDRGVHATGQVVSTRVPRKWTATELSRALNAVLPRDIWVAHAAAAAPGFHARFSAVARGYFYRIGTTAAARSPFRRPWCWPLGMMPDPDTLNELAAQFPGEHSFRAFAKSGQPERGEHCEVHVSAWRTRRADELVYSVVANRFLHHMVRYMVGTMVAAALGRRPVADVRRLLQGDSPLTVSPPAPAAGLHLCRVYYAGDPLVDEAETNEILS